MVPLSTECLNEGSDLSVIVKFHIPFGTKVIWVEPPPKSKAAMVCDGLWRRSGICGYNYNCETQINVQT